ncbi:tRNA (cytidine(34)-2'-O)-methyltransferase [Mycoplasma phocimorsus]|uniref:Putative tRNA (cytidine(34)-2'-O)-methyltransferase n=1 Tax=Mycoplasma phocimorsus TaxID=3045839 RepID=A0AAJ1PTN8_9MOLU|nr:tRNA (cytidine(34)-2'-O)-methyltransferase [Mycoplasma phocimorsus]MDJ1645651.1 tRNA (cytidine(34)-2'-O)-methyltransferase [Mycoplasma phocimorsus]MDJ1646770.1 tRNA (cytidine(34)-2'-O)-methyltransferase [Mycoplasma phocimorsus]MDJ1647745.1 tRNA (cytidine(34)-2'-O)-methyltransferase [Mycoplasma phocimorsus]MDJ1648698.1 tRNA (cytidine(34)-2'-O)-methyltransferase [Mycoplasma phocimorsus]
MINIVLYQPEIAPNTGNIIRTCYALKAKLHIIKPIAFELVHSSIKRAGAGHLISDIEHEIHASYEDFQNKYKDKNIYYITRYGLKTYSEIDFEKNIEENGDIFVMFGRESTGIDKNILKQNIDKCLRIPMYEKNRSINLANSVCVIGYEIARQLKFKDLSRYEVQKSKDFLLNYGKENK